MPKLPNPRSVTNPIGSAWSETYQLTNNDGTLQNITNKTFEFVIRADPGQTSATTPLATVNSTTPNAAGQITVTTATSTVQVVLNAAATASLTQGQYYYALWMDPGLPDATAEVEGTWFATQVAAP